jgi:hypothetical protein
MVDCIDTKKAGHCPAFFELSAGRRRFSANQEKSEAPFLVIDKRLHQFLLGVHDERDRGA